MVWLVLAAPVAAVLGSAALITLSLRQPDPVVRLDLPAGRAQVPAQQGRNHAATPATALPAPKP